MDVFSSCGSLWSPLNPLGKELEIQIAFPGGRWSSGLWSGGERVCVLLLHTQKMDGVSWLYGRLKEVFTSACLLFKTHFSTLLSEIAVQRWCWHSFSDRNYSKHAVRLCVVQLLRIFNADGKILIRIQFEVNVNTKTSHCFSQYWTHTMVSCVVRR